MSSGLTDNSHGDSLKCVLCQNAPQQPLLLTCLHYVCKSCADHAKGSVMCPACLVTSDCSKAPVDLLFSALLQRSLASQSSYCRGPCCDAEKSKKVVVSWCYDCQRSLCNDCDSEHQRQNRSHSRYANDELTRSLELYRLQPRTCQDDNEELSLACLTCIEAKCFICVQSCYKLSHNVVPFSHRIFSERLAESKSHISDLLSSLNSSATRLDSHFAFPQRIAEAEARDLRVLENAKMAAVESLNRAYDNAKQSLLDCYDSVKATAQTIRKEVQTIKARVQRANEHWDTALKSDDTLGLFTQLNVLTNVVHELQTRVTQAVAPFDAGKLVESGVCLPNDLDHITFEWLGLAKIAKDEFGSIKCEGPSHSGDKTFNQAVQEPPMFGDAYVTVKLSFLCYDVCVTDDGRLLLAECKGHLLECTTSCQELSRWRPPKRTDGKHEHVVSVETLSDGRAAVGLSDVNIIVLLKRVSGATGDEAWIENGRLDQLQITPFSMSACDDGLAVVHLFNSIVEVISLSKCQKHSTNERKYNIQSVAITDKLIITASFSYIEHSCSKRPHVVEAHTRGGNDEQLLWRYELPDGEQAKDVCVDSANHVVYFTVGRTHTSSGRVTALSALDGKVLRHDVVSVDKSLSPHKLSLSKTANDSILAVLANDSTVAGLENTMIVYRCASAKTDVNSAKTKLTML